MPKARIVGIQVMNFEGNDGDGKPFAVNGQRLHFVVANPDVDGYEVGKCFIKSSHPKQADIEGMFDRGLIIEVERGTTKGSWKYLPGEAVEPTFDDL